MSRLAPRRRSPVPAPPAGPRRHQPGGHGPQHSGAERIPSARPGHEQCRGLLAPTAASTCTGSPSSTASRASKSSRSRPGSSPRPRPGRVQLAGELLVWSHALLAGYVEEYELAAQPGCQGCGVPGGAQAVLRTVVADHDRARLVERRSAGRATSGHGAAPPRERADTLPTSTRSVRRVRRCRRRAAPPSARRQAAQFCHNLVPLRARSRPCISVTSRGRVIELSGVRHDAPRARGPHR